MTPKPCTMPEEINMYSVPKHLNNDEAFGYLLGYNNAVRKIRADLVERKGE